MAWRRQGLVNPRSARVGQSGHSDIDANGIGESSFSLALQNKPVKAARLASTDDALTTRHDTRLFLKIRNCFRAALLPDTYPDKK